jgi:hypothetical protein
LWGCRRKRHGIGSEDLNRLGVGIKHCLGWRIAATATERLKHGHQVMAGNRHLHHLPWKWIRKDDLGILSHFLLLRTTRLLMVVWMLMMTMVMRMRKGRAYTTAADTGLAPFSVMRRAGDG